MKTVELFEGGIKVGNIAAGCMRIGLMGDKEVDALIGACIENGVNLFDHADIYCKGMSEVVFGKALRRNPSLREKIVLQTKCGIVPDIMFDFSKNHIINSVELSLKRFGCEQIDILLLHRPDTLMEPEEVLEAFSRLYTDGKVKHFGVSNQNPGQIRLLQKYIPFPLMVNQLQFSAVMTSMVDSGLLVNTKFQGAESRDGGILEYCRENDIAIQAWSPFQQGFFEGVFFNNTKRYADLIACLKKTAKKYETTVPNIALAFILRHPAIRQVIVGTTKPKRIQEFAAASDIYIERRDWYAIYMSAGNRLI